jgi:hypothetical protein
MRAPRVGAAIALPMPHQGARPSDPHPARRRGRAAAVADRDTEALASKRRAEKEARRLAQREALRPTVLAVLPPVLGFACSSASGR